LKVSPLRRGFGIQAGIFDYYLHARDHRRFGSFPLFVRHRTDQGFRDFLDHRFGGKPVYLGVRIANDFQLAFVDGAPAADGIEHLSSASRMDRRQGRILG
jgi:hypothetical protein